MFLSSVISCSYWQAFSLRLSTFLFQFFLCVSDFFASSANLQFASPRVLVPIFPFHQLFFASSASPQFASFYVLLPIFPSCQWFLRALCKSSVCISPCSCFNLFFCHCHSCFNFFFSSVFFFSPDARLQSASLYVVIIYFLFIKVFFLSSVSTVERNKDQRKNPLHLLRSENGITLSAAKSQERTDIPRQPSDQGMLSSFSYGTLFSRKWNQ